MFSLNVDAKEGGDVALVVDAELPSDLTREFVANVLGACGKDIVNVDGDNKVPCFGNENARIEFPWHESQGDDCLVEREIPDAGRLFQSVQ